MNEIPGKYLPLGSVILLKQATKRIMIIGYAIKSEKTGDKVWDYIGCLYPEGLLSPDKNLVFDHDKINKIYSLGYSDDEHQRYINFMKSSLESTNKMESAN